MIHLWKILIYQPIYNLLILFVDFFYQHSMFLSVISLTILVRLIIYPLSYKSVKTQLGMKKIQPEIEKIKKEIEDKQEQAKKTMELYKKSGINPFSSFLVMLIQIPIILALYWVLMDLSKHGVDHSLLYYFISKPEQINMRTFGIDLTQKSIILAVLTGISQFIYLKISASFKKVEKKEKKSKTREDLMQSMQESMKYTMPIMISFFSYIVGGAVALYWFISNLFMLFQEIYIQKKIAKREEI